MLLRFEDDRPFAQGGCMFVDRPATAGTASSAIHIPIQIEGLSQTEAVVDTGGAYLVCNPEIADLLNLDPADALTVSGLEIRGHRVPGTLHRLTLTLLAEEGQGLEQEVTAFVPDPHPSQSWMELPTFLGLTGCLEWFRFAVDPVDNMFYFGSINLELTPQDW